MENVNSVKEMPKAIDAEIAVIGSIFVEPYVIINARDSLSLDDFYDIRNRLIFKEMVNLNDKGIAIDVTSVLDALKKVGALEQAGGEEYILTLSDYSYSADNIDTYIELILDASIKRNAIKTLESLAQEGYKNTDSQKYLEGVERKVFDISKKRRTTPFRTSKEIANLVETNTKNRSTSSSDLIGFDTGFPTLNQYTQGFQGGKLIILAARPGMGKSAMALNLAMNISEKNDTNVALFALEMSNEEVMQRMIAATGMINLKSIQNGRMDKNAWARFSSVLDRVSRYKIYFDDSTDSTIEAIRAKFRKLKQESGLGLIVIDYLQLIEYDNDSQKLSQLQKITIITRSLKLLARELDVPVLVLSQLSRDVEKRDDKRPVMSDLRDSGSIEQDADLVLLLYRPDYYAKKTERGTGQVDVIVGKNRSGATGTIEMVWTGEFMKFRESNKEEEIE